MCFGSLVHFPVSRFVNPHSEAGRIRGVSQPGKLPRATTCKVTRVIGNGDMVPVNTGFHTRKNLFEDYS